jgi:hypothetical protein
MEADHMKASVDAVFERLAEGRLSQSEQGPVDGWQTALPGGKTVARSTLQAEAKPLVDLGTGAVPDLLPWVRHANAALRYVAMFALETITGEPARISYFDADPARQDAAVAVWRRWYDGHVGGPGDPRRDR